MSLHSPESYPSGPNTGENAAEGFISWASIGSPILGQVGAFFPLVRVPGCSPNQVWLAFSAIPIQWQVLERLCPRYHFAAAAKGLFYER